MTPQEVNRLLADFVGVESDWLWSPMTDIRHAMMVVDALEKHPNEILLKLVRKKGLTKHDMKWYAEFRLSRWELKQRKCFWVEADTPEAAISLAAYEVIKEEP